MAGFSLKKNENQNQKGFSGFSLKKKQPLINPLRSFGHIEEEDDDVKVHRIDTFDSGKGGAFHLEDGPPVVKEPLVIKMTGNENWTKTAKERFNPQPQKEVTEDVNDRKLLYGINHVPNADSNQTSNTQRLLVKKNNEISSIIEDVKSRPDVTTSEDYEEVPVKDFGAAMLRGMGWAGEKEGSTVAQKPSDSTVVQRVPYLGIGAKDDGQPSILKKPIDRTYVPVKRIDRRTGQSAEEESRSSTRDKSPNGGSSNIYRSRSKK